jgi:hypothetical protein
MRKISAIAVFILFIAFTSASTFISVPKVDINEFESNPQSGTQWVEILNNDNSSIDISGWQIYSGLPSETLMYTIPNSTTLGSKRFYVADISGLNNAGDFIILKNSLTETIETTPTLADTFADNRTWSRVPDGTGNFTFQQGTKAMSNVPTLIQNLSESPACIIETDNVTLSATVTGSCIQQVIFSSNINGNQINITGTQTSGKYSAIVRSSQLVGSSTASWKVIAKNCFNEVKESPEENFYVNAKTVLVTIPGSPDGLNSWFTSPMTFTLLNTDASKIYYQWNGWSSVRYNSTFEISTAQSSANVTGGIFELKYWSNVCAAENGKNESMQKRTIKVDFTSPVVSDIVPKNNATVFSPTVQISAHLDEIYASNSGINLSSVKLYLDNVLVTNKNVTAEGIDANVNFRAENLSLGEHIVNVSGRDNSGRYSEKIWTFSVSEIQGFNLAVFQPANPLYETTRVPYNISVSRVAKELQYRDNNDKNPQFKRLCSSCSSFGYTTKKLQSADEGLNNVTFRALGSLGETEEKTVTFTVDSKLPKITKTSPDKGFFTGIFTVEFIEQNPIGIQLSIANQTFTKSYSLNLSGCHKTTDGKKACSIGADLPQFEGQEISYQFNLTDILGNTALSKKVKLQVDTTPPAVTFFGYDIQGKKVLFSIGVNDTNFKDISYIDNKERVPRLRTICTRLNSEGKCEKTLMFNKGLHDLDIFTFDKAGNGATVAENLELNIQ